MQTELTEPVAKTALDDKAAVAAVRSGDAERYRELVDRHERRVFAVAWSRLGDAALAEEATQEAFIRAYHRIGLLEDGAKFAGWVNTIARRIAITFGLRHRRELNNRERWALENVDTSQKDSDETDPICSSETLRQAMAELPAPHRECLVLFYLEGKSGEESARSLGISESAFRVRLHRARGIMRERLEEKLEGSLAQLRPSHSLAPSVMGAVLASASSKAATAGGAGAAIATFLAKLGFSKWLLPFASFFSFIFFLPMLLFGWLYSRMELRNFRDRDGFRARLFRAGINRRLMIVLVGGIAAVVVIPLILSVLPAHLSFRSNLRSFYVLLGVLLTAFLPLGIRQLAINRNPYFVSQILGSVPLAGVCMLVGFSILPVSFVMAVIPIQTIIGLWFIGQRPVRMDYNLFLRASEGLLRSPALSKLKKTHLHKGSFLAFARFLGTRWLVNSHRWTSTGLRLRLPLAGSTAWWDWTDWMFNYSWKNRSQIELHEDGSVSAIICSRDVGALHKFRGGAASSSHDLEPMVAAAVANAWDKHRASDIAGAEICIGQLSDKEVFVVAPARGGIAKLRWLLATVVILSLLVQVSVRFPGIRERLDGIRPVRTTEADVRAFIEQITPDSKDLNSKSYSFNDPLFNGLALLSTNLFSAKAFQAMRNDILGPDDPADERGHRSPWPFYGPMERYAFACGWLSWNDLQIAPADSAAFLRRKGAVEFSGKNWDIFLSRCNSWSWVDSERSEVKRIKLDGLVHLRILQQVGCLDLTDRQKLLEAIVPVQTLSANPPGQPHIHDWRDVRGLFFTPCNPALLDTYYSVAALEILNGLDRIDKEACIQGILRVHRGKGFFVSPDSGGYNEYHIDGSAQDTIAAYESLRILGALDRVKDLDRWQFRIPKYISEAVEHDKPPLSWAHVEAWVCQQRLQQILAEKQKDPTKPWGSLIQPGRF